MTLHRTPRIALVLCLVLLTLFPRVGWPARVEAATLTLAVTSATDAPDATPGDGLCASTLPGGACTLRAAVQEASAQPVGSAISITIPAGAYPLTLGPLLLTHNTIVLAGAGAGATTIDGQGQQVLVVAVTAFARIGGVTLTGGNAGSGSGGAVANLGLTIVNDSAIIGNTATTGGGIYNAPTGTLWLLNSSVMSDTAPTRAGGAIANAGILTVSGSTLSGNMALVGGAISSTGTLTLTSSSVTTNTATSPFGATSDGGGAINTSGMVTITNSTLSGNSANQGGGGIVNYGTVTIANSTLSGNSASGGGAIVNYNAGTVTLTDSTLSGNSASGGGGIDNAGMVTLTNSTLSGNVAGYGGGGIDNAGTVTMTNSTLSGNSATSGGGIDNAGTATMTNSTLSGNSANSGGGMVNYGTATMTNSTLSGNLANSGGGIINYGTVRLTGAIVANSMTAPNCAGRIVENQGYNLDSGTSCGFSQTTDFTNTNPLLGPLAYNGGPTQTMALLPGSPAIDHGGASGCPATDQRGVSRPQGPACDIGAFEYVATPPPPSSTATATATGAVPTTTPTATATATGAVPTATPTIMPSASPTATSPITSASTSVTLTLSTGWNLVSFPLVPAQPLYAQDVLTSVIQSSEGSVAELATWTGSSWTVALHSGGALSGTNFPITILAGYFLYTDRPATYVLTGHSAAARSSQAARVGASHLAGLQGFPPLLKGAVSVPAPPKHSPAAGRFRR